MEKSFFFLLFVILIQAELKKNEPIIKDIIEPPLNEYSIHSIKGNNKMLYKVVSKCDECSWFKVEMENQFRQNDFLNKYTDLTYEPVLSTDATYTNSTNGIKAKEETTSNGVRRIFFQIDPTVITSKALYFSFRNRDTKSETIPDDFALEFMVKFSNAKTKEEMLPLSFDNAIQYTKNKDEIVLSFKEALNDANIKQSDYYLIAMDFSQYTKESIHSIFMYNEKIKLHFRGRNEGKEIQFSYEKEYDEETVFSVIATYTYRNSNEQFIISYTPIEYKKSLPITPKEKIYNKVSLNSTSKSISYTLKATNETNSIYVIEIVELSNKLSTGYDFAYETSKAIPTLKNETAIEKKDLKLKAGIYKIILDAKGQSDIIFSIFIKDKSSNEDEGTFDFNFKYKTIADQKQEDDDPLAKDNSFKITSTFSSIKIVFNEPFNSTSNVESSDYIVTLYQKSDITDKNMIDNVNVDTSPVEKFSNINIKGKNNGSLIEETFTWPNNLSGELYARLIVSYKTKEQEDKIRSLGIQQVGSYTGIIIALLVVGSLILLGVLFAVIYFCVLRNRKDRGINIDKALSTNTNDNLSLNLL